MPRLVVLDAVGPAFVEGLVRAWDDGDAVLSWTWPDVGSRSVVELRGGGEPGLSDLRSWWAATADRGY